MSAARVRPPARHRRLWRSAAYGSGVRLDRPGDAVEFDSRKCLVWERGYVTTIGSAQGVRFVGRNATAEAFQELIGRSRTSYACSCRASLSTTSANWPSTCATALSRRE